MKGELRSSYFYSHLVNYPFVRDFHASSIKIHIITGCAHFTNFITVYKQVINCANNSKSNKQIKRAFITDAAVYFVFSFLYFLFFWGFTNLGKTKISLTATLVAVVIVALPEDVRVIIYESLGFKLKISTIIPRCNI